ncbi:MAG: energy transducer TonB [Dysgonamonadaceae bacterium]|jgi:TonB family protein|nr:energy transducer TonB [Dysgonamonadaceae bacterium]
MELTKEKFIGVTGSGIFCLLLFIFLLFTYIRTQIQTGEEGILVNFGTVNVSSGTFTPRNEGRVTPQPEVKPQPKPVTKQINAPKPHQTQPVIKGNEPSVAIDDAAVKRKKQEERLEAERILREQKEAAEKKAEAERKAYEAINSQVSGAFGGNSNQSQSGASQDGTGVQGNPNSTSSTGNPAGSGGYGTFNLNGRSLNGGLPRPSYSAQEEGTIVIAITVDIRGTVIHAEIGKGTNIDNARMRSDALTAAKHARFNNIPTGNNQSGTITYRYSLR